VERALQARPERRLPGPPWPRPVAAEAGAARRRQGQAMRAQRVEPRAAVEAAAERVSPSVASAVMVPRVSSGWWRSDEPHHDPLP
jgi:hypothetical protein